mgnify:CR=1 FL=1|tara:strand:+ start:1670 stop:2620 length:951 start_codon:yes stop_codon:yes gene_type:complete
MSYKILLVGAGQLGSRYLQGLKKFNKKIDLCVVDIDKNSLKISKDRWDSIDTNVRHVCNFHTTLPQKIKLYDLAIITTTANIRLKIIKDILKETKIRFWILEKLLAQNSKDIDEIDKLLSHSKVWVNTCDKTFSWFKAIKNKKNTETKVSKFNVEGNRWAIISNGIHLIDFYEWWTNETLMEVDSSKLNKKWFKSKRNGFIETSGSIHCTFSKGSTLIFSCKNDKNKPESQKYFLDDWNIDKFRGFAKNKSGLIIKGELELMSNKITEFASDILFRGSCELTNLSESVRIHKIYLNSIQNTWNANNLNTNETLNIT